MILNAGTIITVTAKNVKVSNPKSLMTSTALATSSVAYILHLAEWPDLWFEKQIPLQQCTEEVNKELPRMKFLEPKGLCLILYLLARDNERTCWLSTYGIQECPQNRDVAME